MTTGTLFNQLKAGKITKEQFLYEVRRDVNLPFISPLTTFKEAIKILQNRGIVTENFGDHTDKEKALTAATNAAEKGNSDDLALQSLNLEGSGECSCGGTYEPHEDAGEMVCNSCGEREALGEDNAVLTKGIHTADKLPSNVMGEDGDAELEDILANQDAEKQGEEDVLAQWDMAEGGDDEEYDPFYDREEEINYGVDDEDREVGDDMEGNKEEDFVSLREQVQEFVKNAMKGGSSMDEAKELARDYFNKKESLNEAAKPKLTVDQVNPYEFKKGVDIEMGVDKSAAPDWSSYLGDLAGDIQKAQAKVLKNLAKDPAYYSNMIAGKHKEKKAPVVKADGYVKSPKSKMEKSNVKTTLSKTESAKGNPKGVKLMKEENLATTPAIERYPTPTPPSKQEWDSMTPDERFEKMMNSGAARYGEKQLKIRANDDYDTLTKYNPRVKQSMAFPKSMLTKEGAFGKIKEYVTSQLKKETKLVKSAKTGETIDVVPDAQAQNMQTTLQKKGVKTTATNV